MIILEQQFRGQLSELQSSYQQGLRLFFDADQPTDYHSTFALQLFCKICFYQIYFLPSADTEAAYALLTFFAHLENHQNLHPLTL